MSVYYKYCPLAGRLLRSTQTAYFPQGFAPIREKAATSLQFEYRAVESLKPTTRATNTIKQNVSRRQQSYGTTAAEGEAHHHEPSHTPKAKKAAWISFVIPNLVAWFGAYRLFNNKIG